MHEETSRHPVALDAMMGYSVAMSTCLTTIGAPHPEHILWPWVKRSSLFESSFNLNGSFFVSVGIETPKKVISEQ
jgi:hypothetical protein